MNGVFEEMRANYDTIKVENAFLKDENSMLHAELQATQNRLADVESRLLLSEQYSHNKNIKIQGIDESPDENITGIVCKLGVLTGVPVTAEDVESCHRVSSKSKPKNIIVQLSRHQKRDALIKKARKLRLNNKDFGNTSTSPVFVNEHHCPILQRLLSLAVSKKKAAGWKYVWCRSKKIYAARKSDSSETIGIKNENDPSRIQKRHTDCLHRLPNKLLG